MSNELQSSNDGPAEREGTFLKPLSLHIRPPSLPSPADDTNKTCIWCAKGKDCQYYHTVIAPECAKLFGQDQQDLRHYIASNCHDYKQAEHRFFYYSNGEPYDP